MTSYASTTGDTMDWLKADEIIIRQKLAFANELLHQAVQASLDLSCRLTAWQEEQKGEK